MRLVLSHSVFLIVTIVFLSIFGCSSSQNTTSEEEQVSTEKTEQFITDTVQSKPTITTKNNSTHRKPLSSGFAVQADTVEVQQGKKSVTTPLRQQIAKKPESNTTFSVQIGAFKSVENAKRAELQLKNRFKEPTHNFFDEKLKMVRVFIGIFSTATSAENFLSKMKKEFPKEYSSGFVWEIKR